jgi:hypothetical protein
MSAWGMPVASAAALLLALAGCTAPLPGPDQPSALPSATPSSSPSGAPTFAQRLPLTGTFVSQGATTTGTVSIEDVGDGTFAITLSGFSTGIGDDLQLYLSPRPLQQDKDGHYFVDGDWYVVEGKVESSIAEQSFTYPSDLRFLPPDIQSITVYDYANRTAFGSAALG